jgi:hypothetical protein
MISIDHVLGAQQRRVWQLGEEPPIDQQQNLRDTCASRDPSRVDSLLLSPSFHLTDGLSHSRTCVPNETAFLRRIPSMAADGSTTS